MYSKSQLDILSFLETYLKETPQETIDKEIHEISKLSFTGPSAMDYFDNFHQYYDGTLNETPMIFTEILAEKNSNIYCPNFLPKKNYLRKKEDQQLVYKV